MLCCDRREASSRWGHGPSAQSLCGLLVVSVVKSGEASPVCVPSGGHGTSALTRGCLEPGPHVASVGGAHGACPVVPGAGLARQACRAMGAPRVPGAVAVGIDSPLLVGALSPFGFPPASLCSRGRALPCAHSLGSDPRGCPARTTHRRLAVVALPGAHSQRWRLSCWGRVVTGVEVTDLIPFSYLSCEPM